MPIVVCSTFVQRSCNSSPFVRFSLVVALLFGPLMALIPLASLHAQQDDNPVPIWSITGEGVAKMGEIALSVGDLNQDGFADIAVGGSGEIALFAGSMEGLGAAPELVVTEFNAAPSYVDGILAGDFDGDGEVDLLLTAPFQDDSQGAIYLYPGSTAESGDPWIVTTDVADSLLGKGVERGDFNGDGYDDLVLSAPSTHNDEVAGLVFVYYGSETGLGEPTEPALILEGADPALRYGDVVRNVGDLNGDGYDDLIIQAEDDEMRVDLHPGSADGLTAEPLTSLYAQQYDYIFADSVAALGDVNGDGFADFAVAAVNIDDLLIAYLVYGAAEWDALGSESLQLPDTDRLDATVHGIGDVDGDGYNDLAFATVVPTYRDEGVSTLYLFPGSESGIALEPGNIIRSDVVADGFGTTVVAADVTGDGVVELLIGAPGDTEAGDFAGKAYLYSFTAEAPAIEMGSAMDTTMAWEPSRIQEIASPDDDDLAGIQPTAIGDINGDGYDDLAALGLRGSGDDLNSYVAILLGSAEGLGNEPDLAASAGNWRATLGDEGSEIEGELSFWHVAGLGDVNGDGFADFGLTVLTEQGDVALIFAGGAEEPEEDPIGILRAPGFDPEKSDEYAYYFAEKLFGVGDVNGDGYGDIAALSVPTDEDGEGFFTLYLGGAEGIADEVAWQLGVGPMLSQVHPSLAAPGDLNGDGYDDLFIGNPILIDGNADQSYVALYVGSEDGLADEPAWQAISNMERQMLGVATITPGDVDGDGIVDIVTSVLYEDGIVPLLLSAGDPDLWSATLEDTMASLIDESYLGLGLLAAGDVNGDGYADFLAGNSSDINSDEDVVDWSLLLGSADGPSTDAIYTFDHPLTTVPDAGADEGMISLMLKAYWQPGDFNGDGYSDLILGYSDPLSSAEDLAGIAPAPLTIYYGGPTVAAVAGEPAVTLQDSAEIAVDAATVASLSPDGQWLLIDRAREEDEAADAEGTRLCLIELSDLGDECVTIPELASVHTPFVGWSGDSRYILLNEDPNDVDVTNAWLFDLDSGDMVNLSTRYPPEEEMDVRYDRAPVVSPSTTWLAFIRHSEQESRLNLVDLTTEEVRTMGPITGIIGNLRWLPDESGLLYTLLSDDSPANNGLWQWSLETDDLTQLYESPEAHAIPFIAGFSDSGNDLLLVYPFSDEEPTVDEGHFYELIRLPVNEDDELLVTTFEDAAALLSPDGTALITIDYVDADSLFMVYDVADGAVGEGVELLRTVGSFDIADSGLGLSVDWTHPNLIFLSTLADSDVTGLLLTVE